MSANIKGIKIAIIDEVGIIGVYISTFIRKVKMQRTVLFFGNNYI